MGLGHVLKPTVARLSDLKFLCLVVTDGQLSACRIRVQKVSNGERSRIRRPVSLENLGIASRLRCTRIWTKDSACFRDSVSIVQYSS
jgi:hypothetical protein